jgi:hypothetical protein
MLQQIRDNQQLAGLRAAETKTRMLQAQAQQKQLQDQSALDSAFDSNLSYDEDAGDLKLDKKAFGTALTNAGKGHLIARGMQQFDDMMADRRAKAIQEIKDNEFVFNQAGTIAENFKALPDDQKAGQYNGTVRALSKVMPNALKMMPPEYGPDADAKLDEFLQHKQQVEDVGTQLQDKQKKNALGFANNLATKTDQEMWDIYHPESKGQTPPSWWAGEMLAARSGGLVKAPPASTYQTRRLGNGTVVLQPGEEAYDFSGAPIAENKKGQGHSFYVYDRGGQKFYEEAPQKETTKQLEHDRIEKAYAFTIGKTWKGADWTDADAIKADKWYTEQLPSKKTEIDKRLEIYERSPDLYQALFGHGGTGADKAVTRAQIATIIGRINAEITKQGLTGKKADDFKAARVKELKDAGIDVTAPPAPPSKPTGGTSQFKMGDPLYKDGKFVGYFNGLNKDGKIVPSQTKPQ